MVIDFNNLSLDLISKFDKDKSIVMKDYESMSNTLLLSADDLFWLVSNPTSRNVCHSKFFYYLRCQKLLHDIEQEDSIEKVITDDIILCKLLSQKYNVELVGRRTRPQKIFGLMRCIVWSFCAMFCKSSVRLKKLENTKHAVIIDTDIAKKTKKYNDRYYGDVLSRLPEDYQNKSFYNIIYLPIPKKKDIKIIDENTQLKTIYLWDFLKPNDYIKSIISLLRHKHSDKLNIEYLGINQKPVLDFVYRDNYSFYFYLSFLYERVIYRMKEKGVDIKLYIDWFENQSFDKSFYWAMNKYYPGTPVHAYIGFMADTNENPITIATNSELNKGIAPRHVFVCNKALKDLYIESGYKGKVEIAPFYRANAIWNKKPSEKRNDSFTILVPMGLMKQEVDAKVKFFVDFLKSYTDKEVLVLLKPHPVYNASSIASMISGVDNISMITGDIYDYLPSADAVVASNSTTTYEALALGKPIIYYLDPLRKLSLSKPHKVPEIMWHLVDNFEALSKVIDTIRNFDYQEMRNAGILLKDYYFTRESEVLNNKLFDIK